MATNRLKSRMKSVNKVNEQVSEILSPPSPAPKTKSIQASSPKITPKKAVAVESSKRNVQFSLTVDTKALNTVVLDLKERVQCAGSAAVINYLVDRFLANYHAGKADATMNDIIEFIKENDSRLKK